MSDTPRTDAELKRIADQLDGGEDNAAYVLSQLGAHACMLEREVERLRAELARLTTLRPHACDDEYDGEKLFWGKDGDSWICDPLFVHSTHWTPLPDVKEPK